VIPSTATLLLWMAIAIQEPKPDSAPLRPGWLALPLRQGAELRFLPLAVTLEDYPKAARRAGEEGTSHLSLEVDPSGHVIGCTTARSSGSPALDDQACQLYRSRGRFELLGTTRPVTVQAPVQWKLVD
jgi:TonB family protein